MAVYTRLTTSEIEKHLLNYQLGKLVDFKEIIAGIDNSNFIIDTEKGRYILTIFESRIDKSQLPFFINLKQHLSSKGICCPSPVPDNSGSTITDLKGKKASIVSFLSGETLKPQENGYYNNITKEHCLEIGKALAKLHQGAEDFNMERENELGANGLRSFFSKFEKFTQDYQENLSEEILESLDLIERNWKNNLPQAAVHGDLFPDNVFFNNEGETPKLSGIIDFYFAATDSLIFDFAITVNAWCFDEKNNFEEEKLEQMMTGYNQIRSFSNEELDFLQIALIASSLRFLLTRLHDKFFTPKDSLVKIKDPQEYLAKLRYFRSQIN